MAKPVGLSLFNGVFRTENGVEVYLFPVGLLRCSDANERDMAREDTFVRGMDSIFHDGRRVQSLTLV